ncbi:scavenger receptor cysteine-rich domain superfamily protein-like isoform X1 [Apostichopus japonicus]|uniref:scavenger receptor cysteine-rich domain superfamily protein-like isoform X1 n=1 Tax=Stichopus japonicus TaxID=307972 RepID=UPI003AB3D734
MRHVLNTVVHSRLMQTERHLINKILIHIMLWKSSGNITFTHIEIFVSFSICCILHVTSGNIEGRIRLVGHGAGAYEGTVEIYHMGQWGTICDDNWGMEEGHVVCRQLGYTKALRVFGGARSGQGSGPIFLDNVMCSGFEEKLTYCSHSGWGISNCKHTEDAGVTCQQGYTTKVENRNGDLINLRLVNGDSGFEGRLEVYTDAYGWGSICPDRWTDATAVTLCRQLGFSNVEAPLAFYGDGPYSVLHISCYGDEREWQDCPHHFNPDVHCRNQVGVKCADFANEGTIRLVGGQSPVSSTKGRVEIFHDGQWGAVRTSVWDHKAAQVSCKQLGYEGGVVLGPSGVLTAEQECFFANISCEGLESMLTDCAQSGWKLDCSSAHSVDAVVQCYPPVALYTPRLYNGTSPNEGRLEVWDGEDWRRLCHDDIETTEAEIVCKELGFISLRSLDTDNGKFGNGLTSALHHGFMCDQEEEKIGQCSRRPYYSYAYNCAGIAITCATSRLSSGALVGVALGLFALAVGILLMLLFCPKNRRENTFMEPPLPPAELPLRGSRNGYPLNRGEDEEAVPFTEEESSHLRETNDLFPPTYIALFPQRQDSSQTSPPPSYEDVTALDGSE